MESLAYKINDTLKSHWTPHMLMGELWGVCCEYFSMMTSSNGNFLRVTGHLGWEFTGPRWMPRTKASDMELWCFLWSVWINDWVNNCEAGDLRCYRAHYDVIVMEKIDVLWLHITVLQSSHGIVWSFIKMFCIWPRIYRVRFELTRNPIVKSNWLYLKPHDHMFYLYYQTDK